MEYPDYDVFDRSLQDPGNIYAPLEFALQDMLPGQGHTGNYSNIIASVRRAVEQLHTLLAQPGTNTQDPHEMRVLWQSIEFYEIWNWIRDTGCVNWILGSLNQNYAIWRIFTYIDSWCRLLSDQEDQEEANQQMPINDADDGFEVAD